MVGIGCEHGGEGRGRREFWERALIKSCVVARLAKRGGRGSFGAETNKSCAERDGGGWGLGWIGGCEHGREGRVGEGSFPRKSNESLWKIYTNIHV